MPTIEFSVDMSPQKRPDNIPIFQFSSFDVSNIDETKIKQIKGAIDAFKIIHSCLKSYFDGQVHMYKPISSQLRILMADLSRKKDISLLHRIHQDIKLLSFKEITFDNNGPISFATAPYYIVEHQNGVIDATFDIAPPYKYFPLEKWRGQQISFKPTLSVNDIIRSVADQDGGAHLDDRECEKLTIMRGHNPTKLGSNILFIISLAHYTIDLAKQIVPLWIQNEKINV